MSSTNSLPTRVLGSSKIPVGAIGHGLMLLTWTPPPHQPDEEVFESLKAAADAGATFWNSGNFYGMSDPLANLKLLRRFFDKYPEYASKIFLSVKGGGIAGQDQSDEAFLRKDVQESLDALGPVKKIDLFELARQTKPVEATIPIMKKMIDDGMFSYIGLSEVGASTIRRAQAIHPVAAVEVEVSLWALEPELYEVIKACEELDIAIIGYSPLGRGIIQSNWKTADDIPEGDIRRHQPKFSKVNFPINLKLTDALKSLAEKRGITASQLALAYVLKLSPNLIPIPGSSNVVRIKENIASASIELSSEEIDQVNQILAEFPSAGARYGGHLAQLVWL
ncbi:Voltage-gated shaker-like K channel, subunit beta/KCNAB [Phaffia rhodozyma]|uniref:Voltage-gated shaker-like K channel, subunit beta/KCNAB n=1 Tax=Phaffia rhodozyma TaxID=264483 RepID=A0A0F7SG87_PHARH|nr:Voltage-gated shaker-like K channel, subunit beta/KCNAB [Phaffia rhodozyma]